MATPEKQHKVNELVEILSNSKGLFLTDFTGLDVLSITDLRSRLRDASSSYLVVKNTLAGLALERIGFTDLKGFLSGPTGIVYSYEDSVEPAKVLTTFITDVGRLTIKSGIVDGELLRPEQVERLAKLPPREVLLGQVASCVQTPLSGLVGCLEGLLRNLAGLLDALAKKKQAAEEEDTHSGPQD